MDPRQREELGGCFGIINAIYFTALAAFAVALVVAIAKVTGLL